MFSLKKMKGLSSGVVKIGGIVVTFIFHIFQYCILLSFMLFVYVRHLQIILGQLENLSIDSTVLKDHITMKLS